MVTFVLKQTDPEANIQTLILMTVYFDGRRMKMSTGEFIKPRDWNGQTHRPRKNAPNAIILSTYLDRLESRVRETVLRMKSEFTLITPDSLRRELKLQSKNGGGKETFIQFIERFIEESRLVRKPGSLSVYTSVFKMLQGFQGQKDFNDICTDWFKRYQAYMENKGYAANYIGKNIGVIRELMTIAKGKGLHKNDQYKNSDYKKPTEEAQTIFLSVDELLKMYGIELSEPLDRVRNRAMIAAFTCLRFSDSTKITVNSIRDGLVYNKNIKTGQNIVVPVHWVVKQIMEMHPDGLPPATSNQKSNEALKRIGKAAGLNQKVEITKTIGGNMVTKTYEKWELITTHTMRRSGATNMILSGIPKDIVKKIGGWTTDKSFEKYNKVSSEEYARLAASFSDYFGVFD